MIDIISLRRLVTVGVLAAATFAVAACNTIEGMGRDIQAAGNAITGSAQSTKEDIKK